MHEFSVAQSIVETVLNVAEEHGAVQVLEVNLVVGEVALINAEQLTWCIAMLTKDTRAAGMNVSVARSPARIRCLDCAYEGPVRYEEGEAEQHAVLPIFQCPECQSAGTVILSGKELHIKDINVRFPDDAEEGQGDNA
jgi:hydrogenase nickel incorporation protein HypA/HybF